jgi:hypothetical protein
MDNRSLLSNGKGEDADAGLLKATTKGQRHRRRGGEDIAEHLEGA